MNQINLCNAEWKLKHFTDLNEVFLEQETLRGNGWIPVRIPSNVQEYFCDEDMFYSDNLTKLLWTEEKIWVYTVDFIVNKGRDKKYFLRFKGVDYFSCIYLNGKKLAEHEGMYSDVHLDVNDSLKMGDNCLEVVLYIPEELRKKDNMDRVLKCHSQYGWDFAPRLLTMGIWDEVILEELENCWIGDIQVKTSILGSQALVQVQGYIDGTVNETASENSTLAVNVCFDGKEHIAPVIGNRFHLSVLVADPKLWFPSGYGEPHLYDLVLKLYWPDSVYMDEKTLRVGIREISAVHCPSQKNYHTPLNFLINGQDIFLKGVNWVPAEIFPAKLNKQRYIQLLTLIKDANCNIIRVWGGGLVEKEYFYDLCDEMGILVFQEFPMACTVPRCDDAYMALLERESTAIVKKLRNHASIIIWSGGNELYVDWSRVKGDTQLNKALAEKVRNIVPGFDEETYFAGAKQYNEPALRLLDRICKTNDGTRPFHISSPLEGEGEVHGPWTYDLTIGDERYQFHNNFYKFWNEFDANLFSEVGCNAVANLDTYKKIIPVSEQWPLDSRSDSLKYHKGFDAAWTQDTWLTTKVVEQLFGKISSLDDFIWANQYLQAEGLRYLLQEIQRKHPSTSGSIIWCFNEPWPNAASSTIIDYFGNPKMSYYYVQKAFEPINASLRYNSILLDRTFQGELWFHGIERNCNDKYNVEVSLLDQKGTALLIKEYENVQKGKLDDLNVVLEKCGPIYVKVIVRMGNELVYKDYYAYVNKQDDIRLLMNSRQLNSIEIKDVIEKNGMFCALVENISNNVQFNIGLHCSEGMFLKNYMTFMPGELLEYHLDKYVDKGRITAK